MPPTAPPPAASPPAAPLPAAPPRARSHHAQVLVLYSTPPFSLSSCASLSCVTVVISFIFSWRRRIRGTKAGGVYDCDLDYLSPLMSLVYAILSSGAVCFVALALLFAVVTEGDAYLFSPPRRVQWWGSLAEQPLPASSLTRNSRNSREWAHCLQNRSPAPCFNRAIRRHARRARGTRGSAFMAL